MHEKDFKCINFCMTKIDYLLCDKRPEKFQCKIEKESFWWHGMGVCLHFVPASLVGTQRLRRYVEKQIPERQQLWISPELKMPEYRPPIPEPELAAWLYAQQPFREILVLRMDETEEKRTKWWQESFLEACFHDLNGLYLLGNTSADTVDFFEWMQNQSGLIACRTDRMPKVDGRKTMIVDVHSEKMPMIRQLPAGTLYLDLTSNPEKQRILKEKRRDISYICALNYLDTAFKARYNAI